MLRSKLNQSFRVEGKKEYSKESVRQLRAGGCTVVPVSDGWFTFWN